MALKNRILRLAAKLEPPEDIEILVFLIGADGLRRRYSAGGRLVETLTEAEFEALPGQKYQVGIFGSDGKARDLYVDED